MFKTEPQKQLEKSMITHEKKDQNKINKFKNRTLSPEKWVNNTR